MFLKSPSSTVGLLFASFWLVSVPALAANAANSFAVTLTIQSICQVDSNNTKDVGEEGLSNPKADAEMNIAVECTTPTPFNVSSYLASADTEPSTYGDLVIVTVEY